MERKLTGHLPSSSLLHSRRSPAAARLWPCRHLWCVRRCGQSLRLSDLQRDHLFLGRDIGCHGQETFSWPQDIYPRDMAFPPYLTPLQGEPSPGASRGSCSTPQRGGGRERGAETVTGRAGRCRSERWGLPPRPSAASADHRDLRSTCPSFQIQLGRFLGGESELISSLVH